MADSSAPVTGFVPLVPCTCGPVYLRVGHERTSGDEAGQPFGKFAGVEDEVETLAQRSVRSGKEQ